MKKVTILSLTLLTSLVFWGCSSEQNLTNQEVQKNIGESHLSKTREMNEKVNENMDSASQKQAKKSNSNQKTQNQMPTPPVPTPPPAQQTDLSYVEKYNGAVLRTTQGDITVSFFNEKSPVTVNNFLKLAGEDFYNGTRFHRIINDFMIQGGDPNSKDDDLQSQWGTGSPEGPGYPFKDEFNNEKLVRGSLAMANSGPNTNGSQFFIVTKDETPWLDGKHTNFGKVTAGMEVVEKIEDLKVNVKDQPTEDVFINTIKLIEIEK